MKNQEVADGGLPEAGRRSSQITETGLVPNTTAHLSRATRRYLHRSSAAALPRWRRSAPLVVCGRATVTAQQNVANPSFFMTSGMTRVKMHWHARCAAVKKRKKTSVREDKIDPPILTEKEQPLLSSSWMRQRRQNLRRVHEISWNRSCRLPTRHSVLPCADIRRLTS